MPVAALQVAVVQGLEERPALVEEVFNLLPLSLGVGFWGVVMCRGRFCLQSIVRGQTAEPDSFPARCHRRILRRLLELQRRKGERTWVVRRLP